MNESPVQERKEDEPGQRRKRSGTRKNGFPYKPSDAPVLLLILSTRTYECQIPQTRQGIRKKLVQG
jgi:hypothetical protein